MAKPESKTRKPRQESGMNRRERQKFIEANWPEIEKDYQALGRNATRLKWNLCASRMKMLRAKFPNVPHPRGGRRAKGVPNAGTPPVGGSAPPAVSCRGSQAPTGSDRLPNGSPVPMPPFPPFNESWEAEIKKAWFSAYVELVRL